MIKNPLGLEVRLIGKVDSADVGWTCGGGTINPATRTRSYSRAGLYALPVPTGAGDCSVLVNASGTGRITVQILARTGMPTTTTTPGTTTAPPSAAVVRDFSGNFGSAQPPFTTTIGETLTWTWANGNGNYSTGMRVTDLWSSVTLVSYYVNSSNSPSSVAGGSGSVYLPAGKHVLDVHCVGPWTVHVGP